MVDRWAWVAYVKFSYFVRYMLYLLDIIDGLIESFWIACIYLYINLCKFDCNGVLKRRTFKAPVLARKGRVVKG